MLDVAVLRGCCSVEMSGSVLVFDFDWFELFVVISNTFNSLRTVTTHLTQHTYAIIYALQCCVIRFNIRLSACAGCNKISSMYHQLIVNLNNH